MNKKAICLTFDTEEWSIVDDYCKNQKYADSTKVSADGIDNLLGLLDRHQIKSTFFITGFFAENEQATVKKIISKGHEIASHSYRDEDHSKFTKEETFYKINTTKQILEKITKRKISGFRTPRFSVNKHISGILKDLDFIYDSSVHPAIVPGYYYNFFKNTKIRKKKGLYEIPVSVIPLIRYPISWIWMRILGNWITNAGTRLNLMQNRPVILYFHSWEFTKLPKIKNVPAYVIKNSGEIFLSQLDNFINDFKDYRFCKLIDILSDN
ncbi:MAG: polysaccharide deacetylase family protein [Nanoarchaeota archaeon]